jgi:hypothetical protein
VDRPRACFIALPRRPEFDELRNALVDQLRSLKIDVIGDESYSVEEAVQAADFVIVDVTGGNANVMFEFGLAAGMRKPVLAIAQDRDDLPSDVRSYRVISYRPGDPRLHAYVDTWVQDAIESPRSLF